MDIWNRALRALQKKKACKNGAGMNAFSIYAEMESAGKILRDETQGTQALSKELKGMTIYLCAEHCMLCMCFYCHR
jgi:tRNA(Arg) A34 adenosine deaminase TadA